MSSNDSRSALTARLYCLLEPHGYDMSRVKILGGGAQEWTGFNELTTEVPKLKSGKVTLKPADPRKFVEWTQVYADILSAWNPDRRLGLLHENVQKYSTVFKTFAQGTWLTGVLRRK